MEDRPDVASRFWAAAASVGVVDLGSGCEEPVGGDLVGPGAREGRDLAEGVPLKRCVCAGDADTFGGLGEPGMDVRKVFAGGEPEAQVGKGQEVGAGGEAPGDE